VLDRVHLLDAEFFICDSSFEVFLVVFRDEVELDRSGLREKLV